jgi:hypothetical protein
MRRCDGDATQGTWYDAEAPGLLAPGRREGGRTRRPRDTATLTGRDRGRAIGCDGGYDRGRERGRGARLGEAPGLFALGRRAADDDLAHGLRHEADLGPARLPVVK